MINYEEFIERYYSSANEARKKDVQRFVDNLNNLIGDTSLSEALRDKRLLCKSFYLQSTGAISRPHYQKMKEYLLNIFDFTGVDSAVPSREEVMKSQNHVAYFRSIDDLLKSIDEVGKRLLPDYNPSADLVRVKGICVLGWMGFSLTEITKLKKDDLIPIDNIGFKITNGRDNYEVYGEPFSVLFYLKSLDSFRGLPGGKLIYLKSDNRYLFRFAEPNGTTIAETQLAQSLKRFNDQAAILGKKSIIFRNLHKNALFLEIYKSKPSEEDLISRIISVINCTYNYALNYKVQYLNFVEALNSGEI